MKRDKNIVKIARLVVVVAVVAATLITLRPVAVAAQIDDLCDGVTTAQFNDVDSGEYGADYIRCMKTLGMSVGRADGGYGPDAAVTRAQMATFVVRLWRDVLGRRCPEGATPFTDVVPDRPHSANIGCLYNLEITKGTTISTFEPEANLTAWQISRFLVRIYEMAGNTCKGLDSEIDAAVTCLHALNVIPTTMEGNSTEVVTRAQMAVYVVGLWHNIAGRGIPPAPPELGSETLSDDLGLGGIDVAVADLVVDILDRIVIASERRSGYDRDLFDHWSDLDGDGCDTRREVLIRDSRVDHVLDPNRTCWVVSGLWYSHYDDEWVEAATSLDIDHLVPLAEAWDSGAYVWSEDRREAFANDESALVAVTARSNRSKGADDPAEWMPSNEDFACPYLAGWIATKARWSLSMDQRESEYIHELLVGECAGTTLNIDMPVLGFPVLDVPNLDVPDLEVPVVPPDTSPIEIPPNPGNSKNCGDFSTHMEAQEWFDTYHPHYGDVARLDADGDGEACESLP